jgi:hypothetical protein
MRDPIDGQERQLGGGHALVRRRRHGIDDIERILAGHLGHFGVGIGQHHRALGFGQFLDRRSRSRRLTKRIDLSVTQRAAGIAECHIARLDFAEDTHRRQHVVAIEHGTGTGRAHGDGLALQVVQRLDAAVRQRHEIGRALVGLGHAAQHSALGAALEGTFRLLRHVDVSAIDDAHVELALDQALGVFGRAAGGDLGDVVLRQLLGNDRARGSDHIVHHAAGVRTAPGDVDLICG